jgi:hypothetical protein
MSSFNTNTGPGAGALSEYMISAIPWVTSSQAPTGITQIDFLNVTSFFAVKNTSTNNINVAFTRNGFSTGNFFTVSPTEVFTADLRIKTLFLSSSATSSYQLIAGVTTIPASNFPNLTGSNNPSNGWSYAPNIG